jgi:hypothetical protein
LISVPPWPSVTDAAKLLAVCVTLWVPWVTVSWPVAVLNT